MINDDLRKLRFEAKRNFNIAQLFTAVSGIAVIYLLYCVYYKINIKSADNLSFYVLLAMTAVSIILSWIYSKKLRDNNAYGETITKAIGSDLELVKQFAKAKAQEGCCMFLLIAIIVASFFLNGTKLCFIDNIAFLLIIFNFWNSARNQVNFFDVLIEKNLI